MSDHHEVVRAFREHDLALNAELEGMLDEHVEHRSERRGCGFTQATRHLAERINRPRAEADLDDLGLFAEWHDAAAAARLRRALESGLVDGWRDWDRLPPMVPDEADGWVAAEAGRQRRLRALPGRLQYPESVLVAGMIRDIVLPRVPARGSVALPGWPERLAVGSCPTAEKCFLELAHGFITRHGRMNLIVDDRARPVLVEKINLGDDHSCVSLVPVVLNGVHVPPGSLLAVHYDPATIAREPVSEPLPGDVLPLRECRGFRLLRLTTLAVDPADRPRAFSAHFEAQQREGLFAPDTTELEQLRAVAERQQRSEYA